ncbi:MAG: DUF3099 domain-containing protein [Actinomycetes bacterium]
MTWRPTRRAERRDETQVYRVTSARRGHSQDIRRRERRYIITMLVRTVCLLLAIFVPVTPLRIVFVVAAVVLPYFAVVFANSGHEPDGSAPDLLDAPPQIPLPSGPDATDSEPPGRPPRHGSVS